jgi:crossover junction endodeoxyribonuclease RuvC
MDRHRVAYLACGGIRLGDGPLDDRLSVLFDELSAIIGAYDPTEAAVEKVFMNRNADSALKLGHARGVAIVAARRAGLAVSEYSATQIKQTVVGRGHADKVQVQHMVKALLELDATPKPDAADALAAAICHGHVREGLARLAFAGART